MTSEEANLRYRANGLATVLYLLYRPIVAEFQKHKWGNELKQANELATFLQNPTQEVAEWLFRHIENDVMFTLQPTISKFWETPKDVTMTPNEWFLHLTYRPYTALEYEKDLLRKIIAARLKKTLQGRSPFTMIRSYDELAAKNADAPLDPILFSGFSDLSYDVQLRLLTHALMQDTAAATQLATTIGGEAFATGLVRITKGLPINFPAMDKYQIDASLFPEKWLKERRVCIDC